VPNRSFKQAIDLDKKNSEPWFNWAWCRTCAAHRIRLCKPIPMAPKSTLTKIRFYLLAGGIYESKQDWEHAKQQYQKALTVQRDNPLASNNLAYVMLQQGGNVDVAFQMAQTARQKLPDNPNTADTLGWAFYHKKVYGSAITLFKEALKQQPDNPLFNFHLGLAYAKSNQGAQARQQLDRVMKLKPNFPDVDQLRQALAQVKG